MRDVDVAVLGAGPAGCATASALARAGARVARVDRSTERDVRRGETMAPEASIPLRELGVWERFSAEPTSAHRDW
jgi:2-polyprenyl-6-methoxyphenol hydroxylase-like FAD-dependent oxidoreductase